MPSVSKCRSSFYQTVVVNFLHCVCVHASLCECVCVTVCVCVCVCVHAHACEHTCVCMLGECVHRSLCECGCHGVRACKDTRVCWVNVCVSVNVCVWFTSCYPFNGQWPYVWRDSPVNCRSLWWRFGCSCAGRVVATYTEEERHRRGMEVSLFKTRASLCECMWVYVCARVHLCECVCARTRASV